MTVFSLLCQVCGLSTREAAAFLNTRPDTVKSWSSGRRTPPETVLSELATLADQIDEAADNVIEVIQSNVAVQQSAPDKIVMGLASDDHEARDLGLPCAGSHRALLGLVVARGMAEGYTFEIVPRGSTVETAAAVDIHERH